MNSITKQNNTTSHSADSESEYKHRNEKSTFDEGKKLFSDRVEYENENSKYEKLREWIAKTPNDHNDYEVKSDLDKAEYNENIFKERIDFDKAAKLNISDSRFVRSVRAISFDNFKSGFVSKVKYLGYSLKYLGYGLRYLKDVINFGFNKLNFVTPLLDRAPSKKELNEIVVKNKNKIKSIKPDGIGNNSRLIVGAGIAAVLLAISASFLWSYLPQSNSSELENNAKLDNNVDSSESIESNALSLAEQADTLPAEIVAESEKQNDNEIILDNASSNTSKNISDAKNGLAVVKESLEQQANADEVANTIENPPQKVNQEVNEIDKLLKQAEKMFLADKLTTPVGDNAYEIYQVVLAKNPNNTGALNGLKNIHAKYMQWANIYLQKQENNRAKKYLDKALTIEPNNQDTLLALESLKQPNSLDYLLTLTNNAPVEVQLLLNQANVKLLKIEESIATNEREYKNFLDTQQSYQNVLRLYPGTDAAIAGLLIVKNHYLDWANIESQNQKKNTAKYLRFQAESIKVSETDLN